MTVIAFFEIQPSIVTANHIVHNRIIPSQKGFICFKLSSKFIVDGFGNLLAIYGKKMEVELLFRNWLIDDHICMTPVRNLITGFSIPNYYICMNRTLICPYELKPIISLFHLFAQFRGYIIGLCRGFEKYGDQKKTYA